MIFPAGEISNMARLFDVCGPISGALDDLFIQADGKEHGALCLAFFGKCFLYLVFDPPTGDRMRREDQQELIVQANGLVDALPELISDLHIFRGKPAAHAFTLQVGIQPVGKVLVAAGIADEAGVVLDGMSNQGVHIGEEVLWHTGFAQKCFGNVPFGAVDRVNANVRWACMLYCIQSPHGAQINIVELYKSDCSMAEVGVVEVGTAEVGTVENGVAEVGVAEFGIAEVGIPEIGIAEFGVAEVGVAEVGMVEVGIAEVGIAEEYVAINTEGVFTSEIGVAEIKSSHLWMLLSPCIPHLWPLPEYVKQFLVRQIAHLLCSALSIERCGYVCKHFFHASPLEMQALLCLMRDVLAL